jgi:hypothetical protein
MFLNAFFMKNKEIVKKQRFKTINIKYIYMELRKQKGIAEIIGDTIILLIVISVVALVTTILLPAISKQQSLQRFELAKKNISEIDTTVMSVLNQPINSVLETSIILDKMLLEIDADNNTLTISHTIKGNYFDEDYIQEMDSTKYNYREGMRLYSVLEYNNINIHESSEIENIKQLRIFVKKINKNTVDVYFEK